MSSLTRGGQIVRVLFSLFMRTKKTVFSQRPKCSHIFVGTNFSENNTIPKKKKKKNRGARKTSNFWFVPLSVFHWACKCYCSCMVNVKIICAFLNCKWIERLVICRAHQSVKNYVRDISSQNQVPNILEKEGRGVEEKHNIKKI